MSHRSLAGLTLAALALTLLPARAVHADRNVSIDEDEKGTGCSRNRMSWDDRETARSEETVQVGRGRGTLLVRASRNGGVRVEGWDGKDYQITACKFASGDTQADAAALLSRLSIDTRGDEVTAKGPSEDDWSIFFIVKAPKDADLSLAVTNGPLSVRAASGTFKVKAKNGPVALKSVSGKVDVEVANGPVSLVDGSGEVSIDAVNGPLTIKLSGDSWDGPGITGHVQNGPLTLKVPETFRAGVRVETAGHGPLTCKLDGCPTITRRYGLHEPRVIELGSGKPAINVTAENGPVSIGPQAGGHGAGHGSW